MLSKFQISVSKSQTSKLIYRSKISKLTSLISHESDIRYRDQKIWIQRPRFGLNLKFQLKFQFFFNKILIFIRFLEQNAAHLPNAERALAQGLEKAALRIEISDRIMSQHVGTIGYWTTLTKKLESFNMLDWCTDTVVAFTNLLKIFHWLYTGIFTYRVDHPAILAFWIQYLPNWDSYAWYAYMNIF